MPSSIRVRYLAIGGCLAFLLLAIPALGQDTESNVLTEEAQDSASGQPELRPGPSPNSASEAAGGEDTAAIGRFTCADTNDCAEKDLTAQNRMADATDEMADLALEQLNATYWEIAFLIATVVAALLAVGAAFRANKIARDSAERQLRAYMAIDQSVKWQKAYDRSPDDIVGYNFTFTWRNYGQTPARRCIARANFGTFDTKIPDDFSYDDHQITDVSETSHFGPGQHFNLSIGGLSITDGEAVERGEKFAYVWTWCEYTDIFGKVRRRTEACYELRITDGGATLNPTVWGPFNGADEDCLHKPKT